MLHVLQESPASSMNPVVTQKQSLTSYSSSLLGPHPPSLGSSSSNPLEHEEKEETKTSSPESVPVLPFPILTRRWTFSGMADEHGILSALKAQEFR